MGWFEGRSGLVVNEGIMLVFWCPMIFIHPLSVICESTLRYALLLSHDHNVTISLSKTLAAM